MKFKQQEDEKSQNNSFYEDIVKLLCLGNEFDYAIRSLYNDECDYHLSRYEDELRNEIELLLKLSISLNPEHKYPTLEMVKKAAENDTELLRFEEKYYNMLKEIGKNALEELNFEVVAYLSKIICDFKHYFCTLVHENNNSGETGS